ncbi:hypothetical protein ABE021_11455 [Sporosarcina gallistercoris]
MTTQRPISRLFAMAQRWGFVEERNADRCNGKSLMGEYAEKKGKPEIK